jgi:hypothetical protein
MCITNQYFLFITQINTENNVNVIIRREQKMKNIPLMEKREKLQKVMMITFQNEMQTLNNELQSMLIDDMITAFNNRLIVMKKILNRD